MDTFWADFLILTFIGLSGAIVIGFVLTLRDLAREIRFTLDGWRFRREMRRRHRQILGRQ
jgi:hypothetical protein